jgi:hypothetical protein
MKVLKPLKIRRAGTTIPENNDVEKMEKLTRRHIEKNLACRWRTVTSYRCSYEILVKYRCTEGRIAVKVRAVCPLVCIA